MFNPVQSWRRCVSIPDRTFHIPNIRKIICRELSTWNCFPTYTSAQAQTNRVGKLLTFLKPSQTLCQFLDHLSYEWIHWTMSELFSPIGSALVKQTHTRWAITSYENALIHVGTQLRLKSYKGSCCSTFLIMTGELPMGSMLEICPISFG